MSTVRDTIEVTSIDDLTNSSKKITFDFSGTGTNSTTGFSFLSTGSRVITFAPGNIVLTSFTESLTNKTITDSTNIVYAKGLNYNAGTVLTSSSVNPVLGNSLTATGTTLSWKTLGLGSAMTTRGDMVYQDSNNQTNRLPIGTQGQYIMTTSGAAPNDVNYNNYYIPLREIQFFDDFMGPNVGSKYWVQQNSAGSTSAATGMSGNWIGGTNFTTAAVNSYITVSCLSIPIGAGPLTYETTIYVPTLADGTNTYIFRVGLGDVPTGTDFNNGIYFEYNITSGVGTGLTWLCKTNTGGGVPTTVDSLVTVSAATWYRLTVNVNSAGTSVDYYINGTLITTITTTIPTRASCYFSIMKTVGTSSRSVVTDYYKLNYQLISDRY